MNKLVEIGLISIAVVAIAVADVIIKKVANTTTDFWTALRHPYMIAIVALYLLQVIIYTFVFVNEVKLGAVGILQTALYAVVILASSAYFFGESFSTRETLGVTLALVGALLLS